MIKIAYSALALSIFALVLSLLALSVSVGSIREMCAANDSRLGKLTWGKGKLHEPSLLDCLRG